jgi:hypothetical protein
MTGRASSSSQPTFSADNHPPHKGPHWTLVIFPDGKMLFTTPDVVHPQVIEMARKLWAEWLTSGQEGQALFLGDCRIVAAASPVEMVDIQYPT